MKKTSKKEEKKVKKSKKAALVSRESKSGKYKSIRHLMEVLFFKDKELTKEEALKIVKKEYPGSGFAEERSNHFSWYHTHIVNLREFVVIEPPKWANGGGAKIKKRDHKKKK